MNILFSMRHAGALRNFASTLEELARRGHRIHLTFLTRDKLADDRLLSDLTARHPEITNGGIAAMPPGYWLGLARMVRTLADYVRYAAPEFVQAQSLRTRAETRVPPRLRWMLQRSLMRRPTLRRLVARTLATMERAIPADPNVIASMRTNLPDLLLVTPLVDLGSDQIEYVKAARRLGVPSGLCVHSWDNLTTKGLIRVMPDRVFVWNEAQRREAVGLHGAAPGQVVVTGAPVYDQWFERRPTTSREAFCSRAGLPHTKPFFLYLCSSPFIAPDEIAFITRWIAAVRAAADPAVRTAGILIRPHPSADPGIWRGFDAARVEGVVVWPAGGANPVDTASRNDYFDSMFHAAAAIGINTSAQIEAGIVGRRVYSVRVAEYVGTQEDTLHFRYLLEESGGLLHMAETLQDHVAALAGALRGDETEAARLRTFIQAFVRPAGLDVPATPRLVDAIEELGRQPATMARGVPAGFFLLRLLLFPLAAAMPPRPAKVRPATTGPATDRARVVDRPRAGAGV